MFYPEFVWPGDRASSESSSYRNCEKDKTKYLPFDKTSVIEAFDSRVQTQYQSELKKMHDTVTLRLNIKSEDEMLELTKQMLDYVERDEDVKDNEKFYAVRDGRGLTREELLGETKYCLDALLLGIWHYIVTHRFDNKKGKTTHDKWYKAVGTGGTKYDLIEPLGKNYSRKVSYYPWNENDFPISEPVESETNQTEEEVPDVEPVSSEEGEFREKAETIEAEVVDEEEFKSKQDKKENNNSGGQRIEFNNYGDGDMFCITGTVNLYGKE